MPDFRIRDSQLETKTHGIFFGIMFRKYRFFAIINSEFLAKEGVVLIIELKF